MTLRFTTRYGIALALLTHCTPSSDSAGFAGLTPAGVSGEPIIDGGSNDGMTSGGASDLRSCGRVSGRCALPEERQLRQLLEASSFGPAARFAAIGGRTVLVTAPGEPARVVQLMAPGSDNAPPGQYTVFSLPDSSLEIVDVADDGGPSDGSRVYALACRAAAQCSLWQSGTMRGEQLEEIAGSELDWRPRGLAVDPSAKPSVGCVYGPGFQCFGTGWRQPLVPPEGVEVVGVAFSTELAVVVGTDARIWIRPASDGWMSQYVGPSLATFELNGLDVQAKLGAAHGPDGEVLLVRKNLTWVCKADWELAHVAAGDELDRITLITKLGRVLRRSEEPGIDFCDSQQLDIGEILASSRVDCGSSSNIWLLTGQAVWGEFSCLEAP